jgi:DoxX-like family
MVASASIEGSRVWLWVGRILTGIVALFLLFDSVIKLLKLDIVVESFVQLGYPESVARPIGILELACLVLYLVPQTAVLGAVLWTGILGGAITSHLRVGDPVFTHLLFGVYLGLMLWGGLYLRDAKLREVLPLRR